MCNKNKEDGHPRLAALNRECWGGGENDTSLTPLINGCRIRLQNGLSILLGTVPKLEGPCELSGFCSFLLAVTRVFSQERESNIVGQRAGIPGAHSGKQGPSAASEIQL